MKRPEYLELWTRIQDFTIDSESATVRFSDKLATEQNWKPEFARRAIDEYKKFMLLCCISETGAAPSKTVDEVWHLDLTYTQSYWSDFCKNTLGKDIHHFPSNGGPKEDQRHREWYAQTLDLYKDVFGAHPPKDIWPPAVTEGVDLKLPPRSLRLEYLTVMALLLFCPFLYNYFSYGVISPFELDGPHFLLFYLFFWASVTLSYVLYRFLDNKEVEQIAGANFPDDITPFQVAFFLYGKDRAFQTSLIDFIKKGVVEVREDQQFIIHNHSYQPAPDDPNPLASGLAAEQDGSEYSYGQLKTKWMHPRKFVHPILKALEQYAFGKPGFIRDYAGQAALIGLALLRIIQGIRNDRPVSFLVLESAFLLVIFYFVIRGISRRATVCKIIDNLYLDRLKQPGLQTELVVGEFALVGTTAISGFAEGVLLAGIFGDYPTRGYQNSWGGSGFWFWGAGGGGSSCGGGGGGGCGGH